MPGVPKNKLPGCTQMDASASAMRPRHEIVAGLGTMGSLMAAVACVFVLAGGVVAFHGWPELGSA
ncbi:MAG: hypothetical protein QOI98_2012, partial [Solirubrobacteraceae bacterium]|nr:hypothetical protein [Solirubrobacteraceae bacterium]